MESSITHSDLNTAQEFNSLTLHPGKLPVWKQISQKRVMFFARYEAMFLWLLGSMCLFYGLSCLLAHVNWLTHQFKALEYLTHGIGTVC
jgi:hypothetical protein